MEFDPHNPIVKLCLQGMDAESKNDSDQAGKIFLQAWEQATNDFEKYLAAHYVARTQKTAPDKLAWLQKGLTHALKINDHAVNGAFPSIYKDIATCYAELGDTVQAQKHEELASAAALTPADKGPFYHGTKADLGAGELLTAGSRSNYQQELVMNHIYFTALPNGAGLAAALAKGEGAERVYIVEPTGPFENDPNVTDKKFPGNPTRSYRSQHPLKIVGELSDWIRQTPEQISLWKQKLANNKGEIIN